MILKRRSFLLVGLACMLFGLLFLFSETDILKIYARVNLMLAGICLVIFVFSNLQAIRLLLPGKEARRLFETFAFVSIIISIIVVVNFFAYKHSIRADLTSEKIYTLSDQSKSLLKSLKASVTIYGFFKGGQDQRAEDLLKTYKHYTPGLIDYQILDPNQRPDLAEKYNIRSYGVFVVTDGKKFRTVEEVLEESITNALLALLKTKDRNAYFVKGHGEKKIDGGDDVGVRNFVNQIEKEGLKAHEIMLASVEKVPDDCDVLAIIGPKKPLLEQELKLIDDYVNNGGSLFVCIDPNVNGSLGGFLKNKGIAIDDDIIIDMQLRLFRGPVLGLDPIAEDYGMHAITKNFSGRTLYSMVRSVRDADGVAGGVRIEEIVRTSPSSWAEMDISRVLNKAEATMDDGKDVSGPIPIAVAWEKDDSRMVVFGDSDFLANRLFSKFFNADLALNSINWLSENISLISIRPKGGKAAFLSLTPSQMNVVFIFGVLLIPQLLFIAGLVVWSWRRYG